MRKCFLTVVLFTVAVLTLSDAYAQDEYSPEITLTFINRTHTNAHLRISEEITQKPYTYKTLKEFTASPFKTESTSLHLTPKDSLQRTLSIASRGGKGYDGEINSHIVIDLSQSNNFKIELKDEWIYPGEDLWPPVGPFRVIDARLL